MDRGEANHHNTGRLSANLAMGRKASVNYAMKPPEQNGRRRSAMKCAAVVAAWLLCSLPAGAGPSSCQRELGTTDITLIKSVLHLRGVAQGPEDQQCAAYRQHVATVSKVREVFERCLSGAKRDVDLRQLEGALDDASGVLARVCELSHSGRSAPPAPAGVP
jgi:hypothetical protein